MIAPGAEEFLSPAVAGPVAAARAHVLAARRPRPARRARALRSTCCFEHEFDGAYVVGVRRFYQSVDDQLSRSSAWACRPARSRSGTTTSRTRAPSTRTAGRVRLAACRRQRVRGSVDYSRTRAPTGCRAATRRSLGVWAPARRPAGARGRPRRHDVVRDRAFRETATRVFVLYKINSAFARQTTPTSRDAGPRRPLRRAGEPGAAVRRSAARSGKCSSACATCSAIPTTPASVYDELLVVRPPKRVVGGFLVRF